MRARLTAALYSCPSPLDINKDRRRTGQGGGGEEGSKKDMRPHFGHFVSRTSAPAGHGEIVTRSKRKVLP